MEANKGMLFAIIAVILISVHGQQAAQRNNICRLTPETGSCRAFLPSFFFNEELGMCDCFIYGGCNPGRPLNLFDNLQNCVDSCGVNPKLQILTSECKRLFRPRDPTNSASQSSSNNDKPAPDTKFNETVLAQLQGIFKNLGSVGQSSGQSQQQFSSSSQFQPSLQRGVNQQQFQPQNPSSSNQQFQSPQQFNSQSASQQFQPLSPSQQFQPQASSQQFQPQASSQQFQPQPSSQQFQPQASSQQFQPQASSQQFQPQASSQQFQPQASSQQFQPQASSQQFQPQASSQQFQPQASSQQFQPQSSSQQFQPSGPVSQQTSRPQSTSSSQSTVPVFPPPLPGVSPRPSAGSEVAQRRQQQQLAEIVRRQQAFEKQQQIKQQMQLLDQQRLQQQNGAQQQRPPAVTNIRNTHGASSGSIAIGQPVQISG